MCILALETVPRHCCITRAFTFESTQVKKLSFKTYKINELLTSKLFLLFNLQNECNLYQASFDRIAFGMRLLC